ncbi:MAG TPA: (Fe-S)-binding protein [Acidimicrobiales bacterium]|nr:(Fe-S)-binding protein [Acidimicrobiales bacterium]
MRVALFPSCVVDSVAPDVGVAAVRVLRRRGHAVDLPADATCCGQPAWNAGEVEAAAKVARTTLAALTAALADGADVVVVPAGSCTTMMRVFWPELFHLVGDEDAATAARALGEQVREFSEFVTSDSPVRPGVGTVLSPDPTPTTYHHSCHMLRELRIADAPAALTASACPNVVTSTAEGRCCGFGGLFSVKLPELSTAMADDVLDAAVEGGAAQVVGSDSSCLMQLAGRAAHRGLRLRFRHLAELLEETDR